MSKKEPENVPPKVLDEDVQDMDVNAIDNSITQEGTFKPHFFRPAIICGVCEACGSSKYTGEMKIIGTDKQTGQPIYNPKGGIWERCDATNCPHYKNLFANGGGINCSGCGERFSGARNSLGQFSEILASRLVHVFSFTAERNKAIMYCDSLECNKKRFSRLMQG